MLVREGQDPENIDEDVVFRTTYYFRIFDYCELKKRVISRFPSDVDVDLDTRLYTVLNDAMYRFTMTGKANTLFSKIKFESGTLQASEIDPLGVKVVKNQDSFDYQPSVKSPLNADAAQREELLTQNKENRELIYAEQRNIAEQYKDNQPKGKKALLDQKVDTLNQALEENFEIRAKANNPIECPATAKQHKGFQVLGPEGWRTFNQEERLIMAMSSDATPLIGTLKELSKRVLSAQGSQQAVELEKLKESHNVLQAQRRVDSGAVNMSEEKGEVGSLVDEIIVIIGES